MKFHITKRNIINTAALATLFISPVLFAQASTSAEKILTCFSKSFYTKEKRVSLFFSSQNKTPYTDYITAFHKDDIEYTDALNVITRSPQDPLATLAFDIADYGQQIFNAILGVIKKYAGKPATMENIKNFKIDIDNVFNHEVAFKTIITKLEILKKKALTEGCDDLVSQINLIIKMIEAKRKEWSAKRDYELVTGLTTRMNC